MKENKPSAPPSIYKKLALHLDSLPGGFPETESGVELRILKRLFDPEQARLACHLTLIPESAETVAFRAGISPERSAELLEEMASQGLIFREARPDQPRYMAAQFVVGIWEYQVGNLSKALVADMEEYIPHLFRMEEWKAAPQMRTVPVNRSIRPELSVLAHERAEELVKAHDHFVITPCICRKEQALAGKGCDKPVDACISFGGESDYFVRNSLGRVAERQEVLDLLKAADKAGLVLQPSNGKKVTWICCCCGCCCGVLRTLKSYSNPGEIVSSPFFAVCDWESCNGCGICLKRCQMDALALEGKKAAVKVERCIGCGLCVSTCPTGALSLERKQERLQPPVPPNIVASLLKLSWKRGKTGPLDLLKMVCRSQKDRLVATFRKKQGRL